MIKNHKLTSSITDASWYDLIRQLEYKANWYGRTYIKIDKFYPSSQIVQIVDIKTKIQKN